jgi:hypothetical protein
MHTVDSALAADMAPNFQARPAPTCMLDRSWKQLMICFTRKPGSDSAAVTAASGRPCSDNTLVKRYSSWKVSRLALDGEP